MSQEQPTRPGVRLDKWLWAARLFKTRSLATAACSAGHAKIDGNTAKPARTLHGGERIEVRSEGGLRVVEVLALAERRLSPALARALYADHSPPPEMHDDPFARLAGSGRPTKRDRRALSRARDD